MVAFELSADQQAVMSAAKAAGQANLIIAGPGTGKTTTLVASLASRVQSGEALSRFVALTATRSSAQQLRTQVLSQISLSQRDPQITTIYGWATRLMKRFIPDGQPLPRLLTGPEQEVQVRDLLAEIDQDIWPPDLRVASQTKGFAEQLRGLLARTRHFGMSYDALAKAGEQKYGPQQWVSAAKFFKRYLEVLDEKNVIDYAELIYRVTKLVSAPDVAKILADEISTIYVDEFAELDRSQINLLANLSHSGIGIVAFGDPFTSVYQFRDIDPRAISDFHKRFANPQLHYLKENFRNPSGLNAAISRVASRLPQPNQDIISSSHSDNEVSTNELEIKICSDDSQQISYLAQQFRRAHADGLSWSDMAVLSREGHLAVNEIAHKLASSGIPVAVAGNEVALRDEVAVRPLISLLTAARNISLDKTISLDLATGLLKSALFQCSPLQLRNLGRKLSLMAKHKYPDEPTLSFEQILSRELVEADLVIDEQLDVSKDQALKALVKLRDLLAELVSQINSGEDSSTLLWTAWQATDWPSRLQQAALGIGDHARRANRDLDAVIALFDLAARMGGLSGEKNLDALLAEINSQQIAADTQRESDQRDRGVSVLTLHRAKGISWPLVAITGLQEGSWPRKSLVNQVLLNSQLDGNENNQPPVLREQIAGERRAFVLAASRAEQKLLILANDDSQEDSLPISRFVYELGVKPSQAKLDQMSNLTDLVARLRQILTSPESSEALKQQAAKTLRYLAEQSDSAGNKLVMAANPQMWWGIEGYSISDYPLAPDDSAVKLSGTDLDTILECPRHWFLNRRARAERGGNIAANMGTIIHAIAQYSQIDDLDLKQMKDLLDEIWDQLEFEAEWMTETKREEANLALERLAAFNEQHRDNDLVGVELAFKAEIQILDEHVLITGQIDRLERDFEGRLRIIDFKTTAKAVSVDKAKESSQLGIYQLAVISGAFDDLNAGQRLVGDAQLVYLRAQQAKSQLPVIRTQPSLDEHPQLELVKKDGSADEDSTSEAFQTWIHEKLYQAAKIIRTENFYAKESQICLYCIFKPGCPIFEGKEM